MKKRMEALLCAGLVLCCSACAGPVGSGTEDTPAPAEDAPAAAEESGTVTVVWTMRADNLGLNVDLLNERLLEDGYRVQLEVEYLGEGLDPDEMEYEERQELVREMFLECFSGSTTDIVSMGLYGDDNVSALVREGKLYDLTGYLESEEGEALRGAFYEGLWETAEVDGALCLIPTQIGQDGTYRVLFNKDDYDEGDIEGFDGTPAGLLELLEEDGDEDAKVVWGIYNVNAIAESAGKQYAYGVLIDGATGGVTAPYEDADFLEQADAVRTMYLEGYFGNSHEYYQPDTNVKEETINGMDFSVWVTCDVSAFYEGVEDGVIAVQMPYILQNRLNCSVGINNRSGHKEEALELLTLLYTNGEYVNLLIWGEEGTDYTMTEDGCAAAVSDRADNIAAKERNLGMFDLVIPLEGDNFITDRAAVKKSLYEGTGLKNSIVAGFTEDFSKVDDAVYEYDNTATDLIESYLTGGISLEGMRSKMEAAGAQEVKELYQEQVDAYLASEEG